MRAVPSNDGWDRIRSRAGTGTFGCLFAICFLWLSTPTLSAHSGGENVFYEGNIGPYAARIVIKRPDVVPGLADISIRMLEGRPDRIELLPLKWNLGKDGAPAPDLAKPVQGEENLFSAQLWMMEGGSQSIEVVMNGGQGEGRMLVPVPVMATRVETMPAGLGALLVVLGLVLVVLMLGIVAAGVRESVLSTGERPSVKRLWASRAMALLMALAVAAVLYGGKQWWDAEAAAYTDNRLYRPVETEAQVYAVGDDRVLYLTLPEGDPRKRSPMVPDHGKLMHLILVKSPDMQAMLHLHPQRLNRRTFVASIPEAPAGDYELYGEVTYETGFSENLTNLVAIPGPGGTGQGSAGVTMQADPDDSRHVLSREIRPASIGGQVFPLEDGLVMEWLNDGYVNEGQDLSLRFQVRDASGRPMKLEPYMGMLGHLMMRSHDGHLFTHLHPSGSFSMASQQLFELRAEGKAPSEVNFGGLEPYCQVPGVEESLDQWLAQKSAGADESISFPWKFMEHGLYRIWVQVKIQDKIHTGVFDVQVRHES